MPPLPPAASRPMVGIALKLGSVLVFIVMSALVKSVSDTVPPGQTVFFRSFFAIPVILVWLTWRRELKNGLKAESPIGHVWRGVAGTMAMGLGFAALAYLPLPEVTALNYAGPLLTVVFAAMFLGEEVRAFRLSAVALGFVGVLIVLWPRLSLTEGAMEDAALLGVTLALSGAVFTALAQVFVRKMVMVERTAAIVFYFSLTSTAASLITIPFGWVWPTPGQTAILIVVGLLGGVGQILLTSSYREADASVVAPFDYASMLFALLIGYFVFSEVPSGTMLLGAAVVVFAGCLIIWREHRLGLERSRQRKAMSPQGS